MNEKKTFLAKHAKTAKEEGKMFHTKTPRTQRKNSMILSFVTFV